MAILAGSTVAVLGHEKTGVAIGSGITVGVVTVFITGKAIVNDERPSKSYRRRRQSAGKPGRPKMPPGADDVPIVADAGRGEDDSDRG